MTHDDIMSELASIGMHLATSPAGVKPALALVRETWSERAAIREYLGGLRRSDAEQYALRDTLEVLGIAPT